MAEQTENTDQALVDPQDPDAAIFGVKPGDVRQYEVKPDDRDMTAKTEQGEGLHPASVSFGMIYSDNATDGEGKGPQDFAKADAEAHPNQSGISVSGQVTRSGQSTTKAKSKSKSK